MYHRLKLGERGREEEKELLAGFLTGQRSLYDVRSYLNDLLIRGEGDHAAWIERTIMLE